MTTDAGTPRTERQHWAEAVAESITDDAEALRIIGFYEEGEWQRPMLDLGRKNLALSRSLTAAEAERDKLRQRDAEWQEKAAAWMASPEAAKRLAGYREMADQCCKLEAERDALRARVKSLEKGLHFYANTRAYLEQLGSKDDPDDCSVPIEEDGGRIARALLAPSSEPQP